MRGGFLLRLAWASALNRRWTLGLTLLAVATSCALLLGVERLRHDARAGFVQSVSGTDLIVGARAGSVQLLLYSVFRIGNASNNIDWRSHQALAAHPAVAWSVPISLGDSHRGYPVLGTTGDYFTHFRHGDDQPLKFARGRAFTGLFEVVVGAEVARSLGYAPDARITLAHGMGASGALGEAMEHADKPFVVVGVLAPTGTPVDRTLHVSLESLSAIHLDWQGGAPIPGLSIPTEHVAKFDLAPKDITATLLGLKRRADVIRMQRFVSEFRGEPLQAIMPGVALDELWALVGIAERTLLAVSALVVAVGLAGLVAVVLSSLDQRRRELAVLRSVGARPRDIFVLLAMEGVLVTGGGIVAGVGLLYAAIALVRPWLLERFGLVIGMHTPSAAEWQLLGMVLATGLAASLVPALRAYRLSLADGLTPRI